MTVCRRLLHGLVKGGSAGEVNAVGEVGEYAFGGHAEGGDGSGVEGAIEVLFGDWRLLR